jgi:hypothetical protein
MCVYMHSRFVENHPIRILQDGPLISEVVLSHSTPWVAMVLAYLPYRHRSVGGEALLLSAGDAHDCRRNRQNRTIWFAKLDSSVRGFLFLSDSCGNTF